MSAFNERSSRSSISGGNGRVAELTRTVARQIEQIGRVVGADRGLDDGFGTALRSTR